MKGGSPMAAWVGGDPFTPATFLQINRALDCFRPSEGIFV